MIDDTKIVKRIIADTKEFNSCQIYGLIQMFISDYLDKSGESLQELITYIVEDREKEHI